MTLESGELAELPGGLMASLASFSGLDALAWLTPRRFLGASVSFGRVWHC